MKNIKRLLGIGLCLSLAMTGCTKNTAMTSDSQLKNTIITSQMERKIEEGKNIVYCSTFQLAWNEIKDNIIKEDIKLSGEPSIVPLLNKEMSTKKDISDKDYVVMVGFGKDKIVDKINEELKNKFGSDAPTIKATPRPEDIVAYAYLCKDLKFKYGFEKLKKPITFSTNNSTVKVNGFGIESTNNEKRNIIADQVALIDYVNDNNFIVKLKTDSDKDEIFLAKVDSNSTLLGTVDAVSFRIKYNKEELLDKNDTLSIPSMDFYINHSYDELNNKYLMNEDSVEGKISKAVQDIRFNLNEKGAKLKSTAEIDMELAGMVSSRNLIFDKPYLLMLREKGAEYPYLAIWVENPTELSGN